jgi:hypothetical protein
MFIVSSNVLYNLQFEISQGIEKCKTILHLVYISLIELWLEWFGSSSNRNIFVQETRYEDIA